MILAKAKIECPNSNLVYTISAIFSCPQESGREWKTSSNRNRIEKNFDLDLDHSPAIMLLNENNIQKENRPTLCNKRSSWVRFKQN